MPAEATPRYVCINFRRRREMTWSRHISHLYSNYLLRAQATPPFVSSLSVCRFVKIGKH